MKNNFKKYGILLISANILLSNVINIKANFEVQKNYKINNILLNQNKSCHDCHDKIKKNVLISTLSLIILSVVSLSLYYLCKFFSNDNPIISLTKKFEIIKFDGFDENYKGKKEIKINILEMDKEISKFTDFFLKAHSKPIDCVFLGNSELCNFFYKMITRFKENKNGSFKENITRENRIGENVYSFYRIKSFYYKNISPPVNNIILFNPELSIETIFQNHKDIIKHKLIFYFINYFYDSNFIKNNKTTADDLKKILIFNDSILNENFEILVVAYPFKIY